MFGTTVFGYLHNHRLEQARLLLQERRFNVTEIAHKIGFASRTSLSKGFRKKKDVPQSIQIVPQQVIEDQQATDLQETTRNVSGVFQGNTAGGVVDRYFIRGFDTDVFLKDGFRDPTGRVRETAGLERVEVLKGPASVLYGTLEPGGIINLVAKKPLEDPLYSAEVTVGSFGFVEPSLDLGGPLNEDKTLLYRFNALYENGGVFRDFDQGAERFFVAPSLTWKIGDNTDITFQFEYLDDERPFDRGIPAIGEAQTALKQLKADPLWSKLNAVQQGKVYEVPGYWIGAGPIAANLVLDDLFEYLVEQ